MQIADLITIARQDYLYDVAQPYRWSDEFLCRSFLEAERQSCNRWNLIFDSGQPVYQGQSLVSGLVVDNSGVDLIARPPSTIISLLDGVSTYSIDSKITYIQYIGIKVTQYKNGIYSTCRHEIHRKSLDEMNRAHPGWRNETGVTVRHVNAIVRGRSLSLSRIPTASLDATYIISLPTTTPNAGDTWWDGTQLYQYVNGAWIINPAAPLGYLNLEVYRLPIAYTADTGYIPEIAEEHHRNLIYWVMYEAYLRKDSDNTDPNSYDKERSSFGLQMFNDYFGKPVSASVRQHELENNPNSNFHAHQYETSLSNGNAGFGYHGGHEDW